MNPRIFLLCCIALVTFSQNATASMIHAVAVTSQSGTISGNTSWTRFAPDDLFVYGQADFYVQIHDNAHVTLDFGALLSTPGTLSIFTIDNELPAYAKVDLSEDNITYFNLTASLKDTWGIIDPPPAIPVWPRADLAVGNSFRYVRITDLEGDDSFDLNAVGFEASAVAVPEPTSMALLGLGTFGFAVSRRIAGRRRVDAK